MLPGTSLQSRLKDRADPPIAGHVRRGGQLRGSRWAAAALAATVAASLIAHPVAAEDTGVVSASNAPEVLTADPPPNLDAGSMDAGVGAPPPPPGPGETSMHGLLGFGTDPRLLGTDGSIALAHAVSRNDEPAARLVLEGGANPDEPDGVLLEQAVRDGTKEMVALLLQHGADPGTLSREGQPMIALAVALGRADITTALLDGGADVNTPVVSPASEEFLQLVPGKYARFYLTKDQGLTPLMIAVLRSDLDLTRMLLGRGASLGPTRGRFKYPLGMAA